jgi:hypothetical protein
MITTATGEHSMKPVTPEEINDCPIDKALPCLAKLKKLNFNALQPKPQKLVIKKLVELNKQVTQILSVFDNNQLHPVTKRTDCKTEKANTVQKGLTNRVVSDNEDKTNGLWVLFR